MRIGVIGTGNIGSLIVDALVKSKAVKAKNIGVTNRSREKAVRLAQKYPGLTIYQSAAETIQHANLVFICVRPMQFHPLLLPLRGQWHPEQQAVSVTSPITVSQLEKLIPCKVARVIPSMVNESLRGSTLVTFGTDMNDHEKYKLWHFLGNFSKPIEIDEKNIRAASDISSCGPAFLSFFLEKMIDGAVRSTSLSRKEAAALTTEMVVGFGRLLENQSCTLAELRERVTVKGGVTGIGLNILNREYNDVFQHLFLETQKKFQEDHQSVDPLFHTLE